MAPVLSRSSAMKAAPSAAGRPARSRTVAVSASSKPIRKAAGAAALSAAILLVRGYSSITTKCYGLLINGALCVLAGLAGTLVCGLINVPRTQLLHALMHNYHVWYSHLLLYVS